MQDNLLATRAPPQTQLGVAYSAPTDSLAGWEGLAVPFPRTTPSVGPLHFGVRPPPRNRQLGPAQHGRLSPAMRYGSFNLRLKGRGFDSRPIHFQPWASRLHTCASVTKEYTLMPCGWEGNRRSGVALAMRHRLRRFIHLRADGLRKGDEHPAYTLLMENESVPRIIINDKNNISSYTAISISVISNHNSFRVLFDKIASVHYN